MSDAMHHKSLQPGYRQMLRDANRKRIEDRRKRDYWREHYSPGARIAIWVCEHECTLAGQEIARRVNAIVAARVRQAKSEGRAQGWNAGLAAGREGK